MKITKIINENVKVFAFEHESVGEDSVIGEEWIAARSLREAIKYFKDLDSTLLNVRTVSVAELKSTKNTIGPKTNCYDWIIKQFKQKTCELPFVCWVHPF